MLAKFKKTFVAILFLGSFASLSWGQQHNSQIRTLVPPNGRSTQVVVPSQETLPGSAQAFVQPGAEDRLLLPPQLPPQNPYHFGFNVVLLRDWNGTRLRIVSVTPGSPAQLAGLEVGDEILRVNGRGFRFARDSFDAVRLLNQHVIESFEPSLPAVAAAITPGCRTRLIQPPGISRALARMVVRNVRNGQHVRVRVYPNRVVPVDVAPAAAAPVAAGG